MLEHFKKNETIYLIVFSAILLLLSCIFVYFGRKMNQKHNYNYTKEEATGIMKLKADQLTRMIEISSEEGACEISDPTALSDEEMETYGFDKKLYKRVIITMKCEDNKQVVAIDIVGMGDFAGYAIEGYISNQLKK